MRTGLRWVIATVTVAAVLTLAAARMVEAAGQAPDPMTALLAEVHALRLAMEQSATVGPRVQLTLARLNIEEQRIAQLVTQLDQARRESSATALESQKVSDQLVELDKALQVATDDKVRKSYEYEQADVKRKLAALSRLEQQHQTRGNDTAQALSTEQARWVDLNARLDELERLLGPVPRS